MHEGDVISISGTTGEIALGEVAVITPEPTGHFGTILGWADQYRRLRVRTNADLPEDAKRAREFGAEGIGLCRTEHMFLGDRLPIVQRMILADTPDEEAAALEQLRAQQESRLRRHPRGDGRSAGHRSPARPAACTSSCPTTRS